jgi:tetratricopeptide (TPR) repeat protein
MGATLMRAEVSGLTGDLGASLRHGQLLIEIGDDAGDNQVLGWGHHAVGRTLRLAGEFVEAEMHLQRASELSEAVPDYQALVVARGNLGLMLVEQGRIDEALIVLEATHAIVQELRLRTFAFSDLLKALAYAYALTAERASPDEREALMRRARSGCRALERQVRLDRAAAPAALRSRGTYQWLRGKRRRANASWRKSAASAEVLGMPRELAVTQLEAGGRTDDAGIVAAASAQIARLAASTKSERVPL